MYFDLAPRGDAMIRASLEVIRSGESGATPEISVIIDFQQPETYTHRDILISAGDISQSISRDGAYEIQNTTVTLRNKDYYFSRKFGRELPNGRLVRVMANIAGYDVEIFRGSIGNGWSITPTTLTLPVNT